MKQKILSLTLLSTLCVYTCYGLDDIDGNGQESFDAPSRPAAKPMTSPFRQQERSFSEESPATRDERPTIFSAHNSLDKGKGKKEKKITKNQGPVSLNSSFGWGTLSGEDDLVFGNSDAKSNPVTRDSFIEEQLGGKQDPFHSSSVSSKSNKSDEEVVRNLLKGLSQTEQRLEAEQQAHAKTQSQYVTLQTALAEAMKDAKLLREEAHVKLLQGASVTDEQKRELRETKDKLAAAERQVKDASEALDLLRKENQRLVSEHIAALGTSQKDLDLARSQFAEVSRKLQEEQNARRILLGQPEAADETTAKAQSQLVETLKIVEQQKADQKRAEEFIANLQGEKDAAIQRGIEQAKGKEAARRLALLDYIMAPLDADYQAQCKDIAEIDSILSTLGMPLKEEYVAAYQYLKILGLVATKGTILSHKELVSNTKTGAGFQNPTPEQILCLAHEIELDSKNAEHLARIAKAIKVGNETIPGYVPLAFVQIGTVYADKGIAKAKTLWGNENPKLVELLDSDHSLASDGTFILESTAIYKKDDILSITGMKNGNAVGQIRLVNDFILKK